MFKVLTKGCEPTRGSKYSACVDLYASEDVVIGAGETNLVGLGVAIDLDHIKYKNVSLDEDGRYTYEETGISVSEDMLNGWLDRFMRMHYLQLMLRSSLAKKGLIIANGAGVIDLDFRDEIKIAIHNPLRPYTIKENGANRTYVRGTDKYSIKRGDRIAQITLLEHKSHLFGIESDEERKGGFGSTGG